MPHWVNPLRGVFASSLATWGEVADLMRASFEGDDDYPQGLLDEIAAIEAQHDDPKARTVAAVHFVQTNIRYFAFSYGEGGFVPRSLRQIYNDRIGDCKDVSKMIVAMLTKMGIEAYPVLVDFNHGHDLINIPARIGAFGHAISCAMIEGKTYWFEGTSDVPHYGDLAHMSQNDLGYALILKANSDLVRMVEDVPPLDYEVRETITLRKNRSGQQAPVDIDIEYIYRGSSADYVRRELEYQSLYDFVEDRCALFSYIYGMNMCAIPEMSDDRTHNELIVKTVVTSDNPWRATQNMYEKEFVSPESAYGYVVDEPAGRRKYAYDMGPAREGRVTTLIYTDYNLDLPLAPKTWDFGGLVLKFSAKRTPYGYEAVRDYVVTRTYLTPDEKARVDAAFDDISVYDRLSIRVVEKEVETWLPSFLTRLALWGGAPVLFLLIWLANQWLNR
jgi:hypothetical protein